jgi:hypothetical protein
MLTSFRAKAPPGVVALISKDLQQNDQVLSLQILIS